jgi:hypothetical protein
MLIGRLKWYLAGVGPESAGYLANDPPAGTNSPDTFIFGLAGRSSIGYLLLRAWSRVRIPLGLRSGSSADRARIPICTTRPRGLRTSSNPIER